MPPSAPLPCAFRLVGGSADRRRADRRIGNAYRILAADLTAPNATFSSRASERPDTPSRRVATGARGNHWHHAYSTFASERRTSANPLGERSRVWCPKAQDQPRPVRPA